MHPPPSPAQLNFTLMTECTPESRRYYSVYSVAGTAELPVAGIYVVQYIFVLKAPSSLKYRMTCWASFP